jgi:transposase
MGIARWSGMARPLLPDDLWEAIAPLLPSPRPRPNGGRPPIENRAALTGIVFVLRSGIPWEMLPAEMGCGSGMSCWRRLRDWQAAGVWARLHQVLLERLHAAGQLDWSRASLDSASVPAKKGALPPARTRRTGASRAPNATSSSMRGARRSA